MITEQNRIQLQSLDREEQIKECNEIIKAAALYERLEANPDWDALKAQLKNLADLHQRQISGWMDQMEGVSLFKRIKIMDLIMVHQTRMTQIREALAYPASIIHQAIQARDYLKQLREKEKTV